MLVEWVVEVGLLGAREREERTVSSHIGMPSSEVHERVSVGSENVCFACINTGEYAILCRIEIRDITKTCYSFRGGLSRNLIVHRARSITTRQ